MLFSFPVLFNSCERVFCFLQFNTKTFEKNFNSIQFTHTNIHNQIYIYMCMNIFYKKKTKLFVVPFHRPIAVNALTVTVKLLVTINSCLGKSMSFRVNTFSFCVNLNFLPLTQKKS